VVLNIIFQDNLNNNQVLILRGAKMKHKANLSRIIGLKMVFILLVSCNSTQSSASTSLPPNDSPLPPKPTFTVIPPTKTPVSPIATSTASTPTQSPIEVFRDIPYTSQLKLDIYKPSEAGPWPVVVALHGGGQSKELFNVFSKRIAQLGAVVFTPTWRSGEPQGEQITREIIIAGWEDAACSLRFAKVKGLDYDGDPERLTVVGYSGGGTAGSVMALVGDDFDGDCLEGGLSALPDAFIGVDGAYDLIKCCIPDDLYAKGSPGDWELIVPYTYLDRQPVHAKIRFYLIVGGTPELVEMAETFNDALESAGFTSTLAQFPNLDHGQIVSLDHPDLFAIIEDALYP
jgi:acetyl esterase/lipase